MAEVENEAERFVRPAADDPAERLGVFNVGRATNQVVPIRSSVCGQFDVLSYLFRVSIQILVYIRVRSKICVRVPLVLPPLEAMAPLTHPSIKGMYVLY